MLVLLELGERGGKRSWITCQSHSATVEQNLSLFLVYHFHDFIFILLNLLLLFFWPALGILVPWPGIEPTPTSLEVWSLNYWTTRAVPYHRFLTPQSPLLFQAVFALPPPEQHPTTARRHTLGWLAGVTSLGELRPPCFWGSVRSDAALLAVTYPVPSWLTWGLGTSLPSILGTRRRFCFEFHLQSWLLVEKPSPWGGMSRFAACSLWVWLSAWCIWGLCF